nr:hypothetical protein [Marinicella sp. W31]MDC2877978.1 hypothetical protein [Marinicella sp. W31]
MHDASNTVREIPIRITHSFCSLENLAGWRKENPKRTGWLGILDRQHAGF